MPALLGEPALAAHDQASLTSRLGGLKGSELKVVSKPASGQYVHLLVEHEVIDRLEPLLSALPNTDSRSCIASRARMRCRYWWAQ